MATTADPAAELRLRAEVLRALALRLSVAKLKFLSPYAGHSTWVGPAPQRCQEDVDAASRRISTACDTLLARARRFEQVADQLATTARVPDAAGPR